MTETTTGGDLLNNLAHEFAERYRRGERPALTEYTDKYPELAADIRELFPAMLMVEQFGQPSGSESRGLAADGPMPQQLGEYRVLREVARGGMGIIYEAVQEPLGRHVALKVLPFQSLAAGNLARFQREARAAANLHHTNIVPVFGVGEHQGVHYYAMQFIQGQSLDSVIRELRRLRKIKENGINGPEKTSASPNLETDLSFSLAVGLQSGRFEGNEENKKKNEEPPVRSDKSTKADVQSTGSASHQVTVSSHSSLTDYHSSFSAQTEQQYYRSVALLGIQAAEALAYAHGQGVLHRDIKPSNLLLDTQGTTWITDFGLAKGTDSEDLTATGDILGTLRYMAPERFQGQADARSDVYGLGVTLYEMLTLQPAFVDTIRARLVERILRDEAPQPRQLDSRIPRDLETIVLKALAKEPPQRYHGAEEFAEDLRRFLADRPIQARRTRIHERFWRWCRRNPVVAGLTASVVLMLGFVAGSIGWLTRDYSAREAALEVEVNRSLEEAASLLEESNWDRAGAALERVEKLLTAAGRPEPSGRTAELRRDVDMDRRLDAIFSKPEDVEWFSGSGRDAEFARAFQDYGIDVAALSVSEAAERIRARRIRQDLVRALDYWSSCRLPDFRPETRDWKRLIDVAELADPDPWRHQLREALKSADRGTLKKLVASADVRQLSPQTLCLAARALANFPGSFRPRVAYQEDLKQAVDLLRQAQPEHPEDFWINESLGLYLLFLRQFDESIRFYSAALAIRPRCSGPLNNLGVALLEKGFYSEACQVFAQAIKVRPDYHDAWSNQGSAYLNLNQPDQALASLTKALELDPNSLHARFYRGLALERLGQWQRAVEDLTPCKWTAADAHLAYAHSVLGEWHQAALCLAPQAVEKTPEDNLWLQLACLRLLDDDVPGYRQLCRQLRERAAEAKRDLSGQAAYIVSRTCLLLPKDEADRAQAALLAEKAVALDPKAAWALHTVALAHYRAGHFEQSLNYCRQSQQTDPQWLGAMDNQLLLAMAQHCRGDHDQAYQAMLSLTRWRERVKDGTHKGEADSPPQMHLSDWLAFQVLFREAKTLMGVEKNIPTR